MAGSAPVVVADQDAKQPTVSAPLLVQATIYLGSVDCVRRQLR